MTSRLIFQKAGQNIRFSDLDGHFPAYTVMTMLLLCVKNRQASIVMITSRVSIATNNFEWQQQLHWLRLPPLIRDMRQSGLLRTI